MSSIWPIIVVAVLALACPLCMVVMGRTCLGGGTSPRPKEGNIRDRQQAVKGHKWFAVIYDRMAAPEERRFMGEVRAELAGARAVTI